LGEPSEGYQEDHRRAEIYVVVFGRVVIGRAIRRVTRRVIRRVVIGTAARRVTTRIIGGPKSM
jgi:hypothetical protein